MPTLVIQLPDMPPVEHVLKDDAITIGRMKGNTITLDDISVSLSHAKITRQGGDYFLKDLNSTNGTMLNGQSFSEARLRDGDHVKFGEVKARYHAESAPPLAPSAAPIVSHATSGVPPVPVEAIHRQPVIAPAPASLATARKEKPKKKPPLILIFVVVGVAIVAGLLAWAFFGPKKLTEVTRPAKSSVPAKISGAEKTSAAASEKNSGEVLTNRDLLALIQSLKSTDVSERRHAAAVLNSMGAGAKDAVPALREAMKDSDSEVSASATLALINNKIYDQAMVPILIRMLHHQNPIMRQVACFSLVLIPYQAEEKEPVIFALNDSATKDENAEVRNAAVAALKMIVPANLPASH